MELIAGLVSAVVELVAAMVQAIIAILQLIANALGLSIEILAEKPAEGESRFGAKRLLIAAVPLVVAVLLIAAVISWAAWRGEVDQRRVAETKRQVKAEVRKLAVQQGPNGRFQRHPNANLDIQDEWGQPLQVIYNEGLLHETVTVRSAGLDGEIGSRDDISASRTNILPKEEVGRIVVEKAADKLHQAFSRGNEAGERQD